VSPVNPFIKDRIARLLSTRSKRAFLHTLKRDGRILDVGCGNDSPRLVKQILPSCHYTGIDVGDYNQTGPNPADEYILTSPENFAEQIFRLGICFDAVISAHNIEHCDDREKTFRAMLQALRPGGRIFLAFPCERSASFPRRKGCLNYFDDATHKGPPPDFDGLIHALELDRFDIEFAARRYRPLPLRLIGFFNEPRSRSRSEVLRGTWAYYGFESIIWARKQVDSTRARQVEV
jgi:SAM-dependent methyltransferase